MIEDVSWIKPGKITFSWWNGDVYGGDHIAPILFLDMAKRYIDFCAHHGLPTHSLTSTEITTSPWYHQSNSGVVPGPDTDVRRPRDDFELRVEGEGRVWVDKLSLMPADNLRGWRPDVVQAIRELQPTVIRWGGSVCDPGGYRLPCRS